jgi:hypothetical protein
MRNDLSSQRRDEQKKGVRRYHFVRPTFSLFTGELFGVMTFEKDFKDDPERKIGPV